MEDLFEAGNELLHLGTMDAKMFKHNTLACSSLYKVVVDKIISATIRLRLH